MSSVTEGHVVLPKPHPWRRLGLKSLLVSTLAIACLAIGVFVGGRTDRNKNSDASIAADQNEVENLLPFLTVDITSDKANHVEGTMAVLHQHEFFSFQSKRADNDTATIKFECDKTKASKTNEMNGWCGFDMTSGGENGSKLITLSRYDGLESVVIDLPQEEDGALAPADIAALQSFIGSKVADCTYVQVGGNEQNRCRGQRRLRSNAR